MDIGERIIFLRTAKQYSVNKLANLAGISQSYLRDIELGNKNPTVEILSYICDALDLSLGDFFNDNTLDSMKTDPLTEKLYRLTPKQKKALIDFLDSMLS